MKNLLLSAAIGDIAGMPYEFDGRTKTTKQSICYSRQIRIPMTRYVLLHVQKHY